jgi:hypothetical protein
MVTLPSQKDFEHEEIGPCSTNTCGAGDVDPGSVHLRLIENMTLGRNAVGYLPNQCTAGRRGRTGCRSRQSQLEFKQKLAQALAVLFKQPGRARDELSGFMARCSIPNRVKRISLCPQARRSDKARKASAKRSSSRFRDRVPVGRRDTGSQFGHGVRKKSFRAQGPTAP